MGEDEIEIEAGEPSAVARPAGRPRSTTHDELAVVAVELIARHGYAHVSVEQIARAAGVSRRTLFRYFPTKADVLWGDFDGEVERLRTTLAATDDDVPMMAALRAGVVEFTRVPAEDVDQHRARMRLVLTEPELVARSLLKFDGWRQVIAEFAGRRLGVPTTAFIPQVVGEVALGAAVAAYRHWIPRRNADLATLIDAAYEAIAGLEVLDAGSQAGSAAGPGHGALPGATPRRR